MKEIEKLGITEEQFKKIICLLLEVNSINGNYDYLNVDNFTSELIERINSL